MVVAAGVDVEFAEEFAGGRVDDVDGEVVDEQDVGGSGVGSSDTDVVETAVDAEGEFSVAVDAVVSDPVVLSVLRGPRRVCWRL